MADSLWSMSTTIREGERIVGFLKTALELEGEIWNKENQEKFQVLLIKNRQYLNDSTNAQTFNKLSDEQANILKDKSYEMTYEEARSIFDAKEYQDPPMRGRQSLSPLVKLGLVYVVGTEKVITITEVGRLLADEKIDFGEFMLEAMLKFQYPNPYESGFLDWDTKPFITTLRLIKEVNKKCQERKMKEKGISTLEFGIFALSLKHYKRVEFVAEELIKFRIDYSRLTTDSDRDKFVKNYIKDYLSSYTNPEKNVHEYTDNMIRYMRLTKYIYIRGKYSNTYIDLEPRRMIEINSILEADSGASQKYTHEEWRKYMGEYGTYIKPFETVDKLTEIAKNVVIEIETIENKLNLELTKSIIPNSAVELKKFIEEKRIERTRLQNLEIKADYRANINKIDEVIYSLESIRTHNKANLAKKYSIELERWSNVALNVINDAVLIKPNAPVGDDNEPTYTAPNGVPDIECYYENYSAICEVTMLTSRDQWYNEGQPVMRHLREFENKNSQQQCYCLFVAPSLHTDTVNTFYTAVKYEYEGKKQKIIPITITQLETILEVIKTMTVSGKQLKHTDMMSLYETCTDYSQFDNSTSWADYISCSINAWKTDMIS